MAELLVRVVDKINNDPYLNVKCSKRGDVISVQPDGWVWGKEEYKNPEWRILKFPSVTVSEASAFLGAELETDPENPSAMLQSRGFSLDLANLPAPILEVISDIKRRNPTARHKPTTGAQLLALKLTKAAIPDPNVMD